MKKALLFSALALAAMAPAQAKKVETLPTGKYPVPIERRVPWTIISGSDAISSGNTESNPLGGKTGDITDLIDRNPLTYWHTGYGNNGCNGQDENHTHWFMIDRGAGADKVPFSLLSIQQRVIQAGYMQKWNGAVTEADIYVTDEFIGLQGGPDNMTEDDILIYNFTASHERTTQITPDYTTQEAQLFDFDEPQTGRFILVVITHTVNPNNGATNEDRYACLSEFNLFTGLEDSQMVTESNFPTPWTIDNIENNTVSNEKRTVMLQFSDDFRPTDRISPMLQSKSGQEPYITYLNWLNWQSTCFDITPLMSVSVAAGHQLQIYADGAGDGLYKALYIDWDNDGFTAEDQVAKTETTVNLSTAKEGAAEDDDNTKTGHEPFLAQMPNDADKYGKTYRARYIVDDQTDSPAPSTGIGGKGGIVVDFTLKIEQPVTFNVNFTFNDKVIGSQSGINGYANEPYVVASPDFFDIDVIAVAPDPDDFAEGETITVNVPLARLVLPFAYTTLTDGEEINASNFGSLQWQAVQQHQTYKNTSKYTWTYTAVDNPTLIAKQIPETSKTGFLDNQLWAFVGDIASGFKIYNKAAGPDVWLYADGTSNSSNAKVGTSTERNLWKPYLTKETINLSSKTYCVFKAEGTPCINLNTGANGATQLNFWGDADQGSTCWFIAAAQPMIDELTTKNFTPGVCVGSFFENTTEEMTAAASAATMSPYDINATEQLRDAMADVHLLEFTPDAWYRLYNYQYKNYMCSGKDANMNVFGGETSHKTNHNTILKFEPVENTQNQYNILSQGLHFGDVKTSVTVQQVSDESEYGIFSINEVAPCVFVFKDINGTNAYTSLHHAGGNNIVGWENGAGATRWYLELAEDVDVELGSTFNEMNVGFGYFPFPVTAGNDGSELYYLIAEKDKEDTSKHVVTYSKASSVPAHTAFMIMNSERTTANLKIDYTGIMTLAEGDDAPVNVLEGTLRAKTAGDNDYVLGTTDDGLGFVKSGDKAIAGNYVYIPEEKLPEEAKTAGALPIYTPDKTTTTGIAELNGEKDTIRMIYDLQGRKLAAPVRGFNIINGKKIIIK